MRVRRAVIPAAGLGTRMRPFSALVPKELVPLGSVPAIHWVLSEALSAGLDTIGLIVSPKKRLLRDYVGSLQSDPTLGTMTIECIEQGEALGLAEAIALGEHFTGSDPFALLLPDNVFLNPAHTLQPMINGFLKYNKDCVGTIEVRPSESGRYGNSGRFDGQPLANGIVEITRVSGKKPGRFTVPHGEISHRTCGRYLFKPHVYDFIREVRSSVRGEYSEVPVFQEITRRLGTIGCSLKLPLFDVGHPVGVLSASAHLLKTQEKGA